MITRERKQESLWFLCITWCERE
uniref:Uncharacterized protein n=1 Tax=Rhizophora mucronata TaxID=61149 RepID=A0A2P2R404_RHIMU